MSELDKTYLIIYVDISKYVKALKSKQISTYQQNRHGTKLKKCSNTKYTNTNNNTNNQQDNNHEESK